jgi:hypothetical protein
LEIGDDGSGLDSFGLRRVEVIYFKVQVHLLGYVWRRPRRASIVLHPVNREPPRTASERDEVI